MSAAPAPARTVPGVTSTPTLPQESLSADAAGQRADRVGAGPAQGRPRGPGGRLVGEPRAHAAGAVPAAVEARVAQAVRVRRDLLRQGRVVAAALRLRARATSTAPTRRSSTGRPPGLWTDDPSMVVHPEAGKWLIALGEKAFGMDPFGWRVAAAVVGSLMVLVMCRLARRMTGSTALGLVAGLLLSLDGLAVRAVPAGAARHLPGLLHPLRGRLPGRRPRLVPRQDGRGWSPTR